MRPLDIRLSPPGLLGSWRADSGGHQGKGNSHTEAVDDLLRSLAFDDPTPDPAIAIVKTFLQDHLTACICYSESREDGVYCVAIAPKHDEVVLDGTFAANVRITKDEYERGEWASLARSRGDAVWDEVLKRSLALKDEIGLQTRDGQYTYGDESRGPFDSVQAAVRDFVREKTPC